MKTSSYTIRTDSEVFQQRDGYERLLIVADWHPTKPTSLAQLHMRVDKNPGASFATASIWTPNSGWQGMVHIPHESFWREMPGYLRWSNDTSAIKTLQLADRLVHELGVLVDLALI